MEDIRACDVTSVEARYHDCCLSDYFQGSHAQEVLAVPVHAEMTYKEAYEACKDEFHASSGWYDSVAGSGTLVEEALHSMFSGIEDVNAVADFVNYVEDSDNEDSECCYLYIGLFAESDLD
jgi:hypothetical protein